MKASNLAVGLVVMFTIAWGTAAFWQARAEEQELGSKPFAEALEAIRTKHQLPALAAAACVEGRIVELGATGVRRSDATEMVTVNDLWHIGSCTKSMTASLAAMLVEEGKIQWETTVGQALKGTPKMNEGWRDVTLEQLLQHRSGAPANPPASLWQAAWKQVGTPTQQRRAFVTGLLGTAPEAKPGTHFQYSNQGYAIAGAMLEQITGKPWEELMRDRLFRPLGMQSAGFGAPGPKDQPLGHEGKQPPLRPKPVGPGDDNPPAIGPAGTVHCSISDLVRYAAWHADAGRGEKPLLKPDTFARLHRPAETDGYALGWSVTERPWAGGTALTHTGSNTMWYTVIWVAPEKRAAFVATTNAASNSAFAACDAAIAQLIGRTLKAGQ